MIKCADSLDPSGNNFQMPPFSGWVETALRDAIKRGNDTLHTQLHPASTNQAPGAFGGDPILWDPFCLSFNSQPHPRRPRTSGIRPARLTRAPGDSWRDILRHVPLFFPRENIPASRVPLEAAASEIDPFSHSKRELLYGPAFRSRSRARSTTWRMPSRMGAKARSWSWNSLNISAHGLSPGGRRCSSISQSHSFPPV